MRVIHWLFVVSAALFISGIGFVIAGARTRKRRHPRRRAPAITPVATVKQIMDGIVAPSATAVFDSVGTIVDATGIHEKRRAPTPSGQPSAPAPRRSSKSANLLVMGDRAVDRGRSG